MASAPVFAARPGVFRIEDALEDEFSRPELPHPFHVFPAQRRIELARVHVDSELTFSIPFTWPGEISECLFASVQDAPGPARLGRDVDDILQPDFRRHCQAVLDVAMALSENLQIDGQHQRGAFRCLGARDQVFDELAVADNVELELERLAGRLRRVLDGADRHGRKTTEMPAALAARAGQGSPFARRSCRRPRIGASTIEGFALLPDDASSKRSRSRRSRARRWRSLMP